MEAKTAGDLMIPLEFYPKISFYSTIREAIAFMQFTEIVSGSRRSMPRSLLVFKNDNQLVGMVRRRDILRGIEPELLLKSRSSDSTKLYEMEIDPDLLELSYKSFLQNIILRSSVTVGEIMVPIEYTVNVSDHLVKIIYELDHHKQTLIPVLQNEEIVGVLRTLEIMDEIANILNIKGLR